MKNENYWDELFVKINSMTDEEFERLVIELDGTEDLPCGVYEEFQPLLCDYMLEGDTVNGNDYTIDLYYDNSSKDNYRSVKVYDISSDFEAA